ncbi:hypothetical protein QOT17_010979 [Balamuthia mandrillaris]
MALEESLELKGHPTVETSLGQCSLARLIQSGGEVLCSDAFLRGCWIMPPVMVDRKSTTRRPTLQQKPLAN